MTEFAKVVRWTAPGSVALALMVGVVLLSRALLEMFALRPESRGPLLNIDTATLLTGAALTVPIGFMIYQLYFFAFSRPVKVFRAVRGDFANEVFDRVGLSRPQGVFAWEPQKSKEPVLRRTRWSLGWLESRIQPKWLRHRSHQAGRPWLGVGKEDREVEHRYIQYIEDSWDDLQAAIDRSDLPGADRMRGQVDRLGEIYHTLGASQRALTLGWSAGAVWALVTALEQREADDPTWAVLVVVGMAIVVSFGAMMFLFTAFHANRRHCSERRNATMRALVSKPARIP